MSDKCSFCNHPAVYIVREPDFRDYTCCATCMGTVRKLADSLISRPYQVMTIGPVPQTTVWEELAR